MRKVVVVLVALAGVSALVASAEACGDKYMVVGRGVKYSRSKHAASILIYGSPSSQGATLRDAKFEASLKKAGHSVRSVSDPAALDSALNDKPADLVLADLADSPRLQKQVGSGPTRPTVVPVLFQPTESQLAVAEKEYGCALKAPSKDYLTTLDDIMARKLKASRSKAAKSQ